MAFWIGLIYRGARACGLKESLSTATEMGVLHFPDGFPDTPTGRVAEDEQRAALEGKYKRMPPAKRPNYIKLGIVAPFHFPWRQLVTDWVQTQSLKVIETKPEQKTDGTEQKMHTDSEVGRDNMTSGDVVVLRNKRLLQQLDEVCSGQYDGRRRKVPKASTQYKSVREGYGDKRESVLNACIPHKACLVAVRLRASHRGVVEPFSVVSIPTPDDLLALQQDRKHGGPLEPYHQEDQPDKVQKTDTKGEVKKTKGLCEDVSNVRDYSSRSAIGFVKQGGYHLCDGRGAGIGFVVVEGLRTLLESKRADETSTTVLVRSPRSNQYRYASLSILI